MRWLYILDEDDPDFIAKQETISRIEKWWQDFEATAVPLWNKRSEWFEQPGISEFAQWVSTNIKKIHPNILWEVQQDDMSNDVFICTVEDNYTHGGIVHTMVKMAPQLDKWCFLRYRPPCDFDTIPKFLKHSAGLNVPNDIRVSWVKSEINKIDLCYYSGTFTGDLRIDLALTLKLTSAILGEEMFENWINEAEALKPISTPARMLNNLIGKSSPVTHNTSNLLNQCLKIKKQIVDSLPDKYVSELILPHHHDDTPVFMWHRTPNEDAVPAYIPRRLIYCFTIDSLLKAVLSGIYFHSHCHSKLNEIFCFIEITDFDMGQNDSLERRDNIAIRIDNELRQKALGCVIGVGSGMDSCYVDLALRNVEKSVPILREIASDMEFPESSWLLFYDSNLRDEWVGLYKITKAPPVIEEEPLDYKPNLD